MASRRAGQGLVEYALIVALVVIVVVAVLALLGRQILDAFQNVANTLQGP
jgi:pilus assembly protein Flp/PilA